MTVSLKRERKKKIFWYFGRCPKNKFIDLGSVKFPQFISTCDKCFLCYWNSCWEIWAWPQTVFILNGQESQQSRRCFLVPHGKHRNKVRLTPTWQAFLVNHFILNLPSAGTHVAFPLQMSKLSYKMLKKLPKVSELENICLEQPDESRSLRC